jgi:hypothetical protein
MTIKNELILYFFFSTLFIERRIETKEMNAIIKRIKKEKKISLFILFSIHTYEILIINHELMPNSL